jgi:hypothetical protein
VRRDRNYYLLRIWLSFALAAVLTCCAAPSFAQKTVVQDAGSGRKVELVYNADGQVTQQRTIGEDGKLLQRVDFEYHPGFFGADQTNTSYWPDGKVNKVTRNTYDASSNFTSEFVQVFDESGKQIAGHQLTHDPMTNVYTCAEWNTAAQKYKLIECPSGEESGSRPEEVKKYTYDEVMQHLEAARKAAGEEGKLQPKPPVKSTAPAASVEFGFVMPAQIYPGERVSGSVVANPVEYEGMPAVTVTRVAVAAEAAQTGTPAGWTVDVPGESSQRVDGPIVFTVPTGGGLNITFRPTENSAQSISKLISFPQSAAKKQKAAGSFEVAALCLKGQLCTVRGPFSGDSSKTFAAFEDRPATVVAETPNTAYIAIPKLTEPGARTLFIAEGPTMVALPLAVGEFSIGNGGRELQAGQVLVTYPVLDGPADISDAAWRPGNFPATNLDEARKLVPGFQLPRDDREAREKREAQEKGESKDKRVADEKKGGAILLVVRNLTPEQVSLRGAKNQMIVFHLNDESFSRGEFKYDLVVEAIKSGHFDVKGCVIPFLAPVRGQEFSRNSNSAGK